MEDVGEFVDGPGEFPGILDKLRHSPQSDEQDGARLYQAVFGIHIQDSAEDGHQRKGHVVDQVDGGEQEGCIVLRVVERPHGFIVVGIEAARNHVLPPVCPDAGRAGKHLFGIAVELAVLPGAGAEQGTHLFGAVPGEQDRNRHGDHENQNHRPGNLPHEHQRAHHGVDAGHDLHQVVGQGGVHRIHVIGYAADDVPGGVGVEIPHGQRVQLLKNLSAHGIYDSLAQVHHDYRQEIGDDGRAGVADNHLDYAVPDRPKVHPRGQADGIDCGTGIPRTQKRHLI